MTELNVVPQFEGIGIPSPSFDDAAQICTDVRTLPVREYYKWANPDNVHEAEKRGPFGSAAEYVQQYRDERYTWTDEEAYFVGVDFHKIVDIIFSHPALSADPSDGFVLQHSDLDLQNILVDEAGNVTGTLNWYGSIAVPQSVGPASVPMFLRRDWLPDTLERPPYLCWRAPYYREIYAAAMAEETESPDAIYTLKLGIYRAAWAALYEGGCMMDFVRKRLATIPGSHLTDVDLYETLGRSWPDTEIMLKKEIWKLLTPELPKEGVLAAVEAELGMQTALLDWMEEFETFDANEGAAT